ncbi:MAG TPA: glycosyltransferase family 1 protein, partial [Rhodopila sp.]|nr:glycosyltransferase family 1 protein [Rhodopila sp.]
SDIPTFRELWDDAAIFVPPEDPVALANALRHALQDSTEYARLGTLARNRAACFDPAQMTDETWRIHAAVLAREAT